MPASFPLDQSIIEKAVELLSQNRLCNNCFGRQFALLCTGSSNHDRGSAIKLVLALQGHQLMKSDQTEQGQKVLTDMVKNGFSQVAQSTLEEHGVTIPFPEMSCEICNNAFKKIPQIVALIQEKIVDYEYANFVVGSRIPPETIEHEDQIRMRLHLPWGESIKREINRELGKALAEASGKPPEFVHPEMMIVWDIASDNIEIKTSSVFIVGRYRKLIRGIPQTRWPCSDCNGKGCEECGGTGKRYATSVEEQVREPYIKAFQAEDAKFHGAGREDIDARMLGTGRPFSIELMNPKKRHTDLKKLQKQVNRQAKGVVEVNSLDYSSNSVMQELKASAPDSSKTYKALVNVEHSLGASQLTTLDAALTQTVIHQQTPTRVIHRRADKVRVKQVYSCKSAMIDSTHFDVEIHCQGGLYIKELISGDNGRTIPSMTSLLGITVVCEELDVINVQSEAITNGKESTRRSP